MEQNRRQRHALVFLRTVLAAVMFVHGAARIYLGIVGGFGEFLTLQGLPLGFYLAWAITVFEIVAAVALAAGYYVPILASVFAAHLLAGVYLVHAKDGWFTVGAGRNGAEFSVVLILSFAAVAYAHYGIEPKRRRRY